MPCCKFDKDRTRTDFILLTQNECEALRPEHKTTRFGVIVNRCGFRVRLRIVNDDGDKQCPYLSDTGTCMIAYALPST